MNETPKSGDENVELSETEIKAELVRQIAEAIRGDDFTFDEEGMNAILDAVFTVAEDNDNRELGLAVSKIYAGTNTLMMKAGMEDLNLEIRGNNGVKITIGEARIEKETDNDTRVNQVGFFKKSVRAVIEQITKNCDGELIAGEDSTVLVPREKLESAKNIVRDSTFVITAEEWTE